MSSDKQKNPLFELMDSHLSKTRLKNENNPSPSTSDMLLSTLSGPRLDIPDYFPGNSPIKDFLAEKISNTFKAKEKRKQEEKQRKIEEEMKKLKIRKEKQGEIEEEIKSIKIEQEQYEIEEVMKNLKLEEQDQREIGEEMKSSKIQEQEKFPIVDAVNKPFFYVTIPGDEEHVIDLTPAIIQQKNEIEARHAIDKSAYVRLKLGIQSLPDLRFCWDKETWLYQPWNPKLPCTKDISCILKQKIQSGKCSKVGKVLCSRPRSACCIAHPHETENFYSIMERFDFKTKSPRDIYKENQRKPKISTRWTVDSLDCI